MIGKKRKLGKMIEDIHVGDSYTSTHIIQDKDLLLYLGITNDANPLYIQHDYASQTPYKQPIIPSVMLLGIVSSIISMHLPGPGSHIINQSVHYPHALYHGSEVNFHLEVTKIDEKDHQVTIAVTGFDRKGEEVLQGEFLVHPPYKPKSITASSLENFF